MGKSSGWSANHRHSGARGPLCEHFTTAYGRGLFHQDLRRRMVFADHSLATDSVFSEVQLVLCRNVLIYFNRVLQDRAIGLFRESLCRRGFLGLGPRESLRFSRHAPAFEEIEPASRIFRMRAGELRARAPSAGHGCG